MKSLLKISLVIALIFVGCKAEKKEEIKATNNDYQFIGNELSVGEALSAEAMLEKFKNLQVGDTIPAKFASTIKEVCTKKGCWMKLPLNDETEAMVKFKDYGFFMPLDSKDREVIVEGKAYVTETSVNELRHYAEDAGKSKEEIAKITESKREFAFEAHGVLMKE